MKSKTSRLEWYLICNPTSGGGINHRSIKRILNYFKKFNLSYQLVLTEYPHHEEKLVRQAIKNGYLNFVCIGGDGTIHHMINGIMKQTFVDPKEVTLAAIPKGTGNDWVKNYNISNSEEKAVELIHKNKRLTQDIGKITLNTSKKVSFFTNAAGLGFDAYVVKNIEKYRKWKKLAYLLGGLTSFASFKESEIEYNLGSLVKKNKLFMMNIGLCKYSGGGMQLTDYSNHQQGFFDITLIESITFSRIIRNLNNLYKGKIAKIREVECHRSKKIEVYTNQNYYIQADGELIDTGPAVFEIITSAIQFIIA
ncbi:diacylglycerol/lipid kinase family protein [Lutimonas zeaxanthinifaciens]|uniref:diacylglycerol/lipid kinase family protein n=1 Tax=Lutimonas zeaxanthinifaciens TaxID=3060215 RepID=UPI00265CF133|nr:diacylglycerol kinase family protein [Lutimonas sp. YSD2104]WKK66022.1 diacylglycerol kinase family lipid kinase [Lutimonas sp. YSD2104]